MRLLASKWILTTNVYLVRALITKDDTENGGIVSCLRLHYHMSIASLPFHIKLSNLEAMSECMIVWEPLVHYCPWLNNTNVLTKSVFLNWLSETVLEVYWRFERYFEVSIGFFVLFCKKSKILPCVCNVFQV